MNKKVIYLGIGLLALVGVYLVVFDYLGGNNPILISYVDEKPPILVGLTYEGTPQDDRLGSTFEKIESILSTQPGKKLHTIYEIEPSGKLDTMRVFIGFEHALIQETLEIREFPQTGYLVASLKGNRFVMPSPNKVKKELEEFAAKEGYSLSGVFIDRILSENQVQVLAPVE